MAAKPRSRQENWAQVWEQPRFLVGTRPVTVVVVRLGDARRLVGADGKSSGDAR
jgi:hypothetical protein